MSRRIEHKPQSRLHEGILYIPSWKGSVLAWAGDGAYWSIQVDIHSHKDGGVGKFHLGAQDKLVQGVHPMHQGQWVQLHKLHEELFGDYCWVPLGLGREEWPYYGEAWPMCNLGRGEGFVYCLLSIFRKGGSLLSDILNFFVHWLIQVQSYNDALTTVSTLSWTELVNETGCHAKCSYKQYSFKKVSCQQIDIRYVGLTDVLYTIFHFRSAMKP